MAEICCPQCGNRASLRFAGQSGSRAQLRLRGILSCTAEIHHGSYEWPITIRATQEGQIENTAEMLPISESSTLKNVPPGLKEDIQEAERAHFSQCFKASVVMCRRAIQLALEEYLQEERLTLGPLLQLARESKPSLLSNEKDILAERVKSLGDAGAHHIVRLSPKQVEVAIFDTVAILNELYQKPLPASQ